MACEKMPSDKESFPHHARFIADFLHYLVILTREMLPSRQLYKVAMSMTKRYRTSPFNIRS